MAAPTRKITTTRMVVIAHLRSQPAGRHYRSRSTGEATGLAFEATGHGASDLDVCGLFSESEKASVSIRFALKASQKTPAHMSATPNRKIADASGIEAAAKATRPKRPSQNVMNTASTVCMDIVTLI